MLEELVKLLGERLKSLGLVFLSRSQAVWCKKLLFFQICSRTSRRLYLRTSAASRNFSLAKAISNCYQMQA